MSERQTARKTASYLLRFSTLHLLHVQPSLKPHLIFSPPTSPPAHPPYQVNQVTGADSCSNRGDTHDDLHRGDEAVSVSYAHAQRSSTILHHLPGNVIIDLATTSLLPSRGVNPNLLRDSRPSDMPSRHQHQRNTPHDPRGGVRDTVVHSSSSPLEFSVLLQLPLLTHSTTHQPLAPNRLAHLLLVRQHRRRSPVIQHHHDQLLSVSTQQQQHERQQQRPNLMGGSRWPQHSAPHRQRPPH